VQPQPLYIVDPDISVRAADLLWQNNIARSVMWMESIPAEPCIVIADPRHRDTAAFVAEFKYQRPNATLVVFTERTDVLSGTLPYDVFALNKPATVSPQQEAYNYMVLARGLARSIANGTWKEDYGWTLPLGNC
jgi:hypothetical protein